MREQKRNRREGRNPKPTHKETKNNSNYILSVPHDVAEEILQQLQVKSLVSFKSVSKQWRSTIQSQGFVERHLIRQKSRTAKILSSSVMGTGDAVGLTSFSVEDGEQIHRSYSLSDIFHPPLRFPGSCDGLVCVYDKLSIYVINPTTREIRKLPPTNSQIHSNDSNPSVMQDVPLSSVGFGRDNVAGTYKVVLLYPEHSSDMLNNEAQDHNGHTKCEVFALDTGIWRCVEPIPCEISSKKRSVYVNGSLFWFTRQIHPTLLALDLHTEKFHAMPNPGFYHPLDLSVFMYSRCDQLLATTIRNYSIKIWGLYPDEEWKELRTIDYIPVPLEARRHDQPSVFATNYIREKLPLPNFHINLLKHSPELLCNMFCTDDEISYIESLVSVYQ